MSKDIVYCMCTWKGDTAIGLAGFIEFVRFLSSLEEALSRSLLAAVVFSPPFGLSWVDCSCKTEAPRQFNSNRNPFAQSLKSCNRT